MEFNRRQSPKNLSCELANEYIPLASQAKSQGSYILETRNSNPTRCFLDINTSPPRTQFNPKVSNMSTSIDVHNDIPESTDTPESGHRVFDDRMGRAYNIANVQSNWNIAKAKIDTKIYSAIPTPAVEEPAFIRKEDVAGAVGTSTSSFEN